MDGKLCYSDIEALNDWRPSSFAEWEWEWGWDEDENENEDEGEDENENENEDEDEDQDQDQDGSTDSKEAETESGISTGVSFLEKKLDRMRAELLNGYSLP